MRSGRTIYLDHQATTPIDPRVLAEMRPYFETSFANPHSADHVLGWDAARAVDEAASRVAGLLGADRDEIIFTSGATESNNLALLGIGRGQGGGTRRRILVSAIEHKCVLAACRALERQLGYETHILPVDGRGRLDISELNGSIGDDVLFISIMAVNNEIGTIQDIRTISEIARAHGVLFHCDAAQASFAINLQGVTSLVDLLSLSGHKMYGPKGIGALYVRRDLQRRIEPLFYGGAQQGGLRAGTLPVPLCVGMGAAAVLAAGDSAREERAYLRGKRNRFVERLCSLSWPIVLNGPDDDIRHPGNANVRFRGFSADEILGALQPDVAASTGSACSSGFPEPSHVLRAIGLTTEEAEASIRFSVGRSTTDADVDEAVEFIERALERLAAAQSCLA